MPVNFNQFWRTCRIRALGESRSLMNPRFDRVSRGFAEEQGMRQRVEEAGKHSVVVD